MGEAAFKKLRYAWLDLHIRPLLKIAAAFDVAFVARTHTEGAVRLRTDHLVRHDGTGSDGKGEAAPIGGGMRGRFVPQSTIDRRMAAKDARINRAIARRQVQLTSCTHPDRGRKIDEAEDVDRIPASDRKTNLLGGPNIG